MADDRTALIEDDFALGADDARQDRLAEERRRKRQAILAKHAAERNASDSLTSALSVDGTQHHHLNQEASSSAISKKRQAEGEAYASSSVSVPKHSSSVDEPTVSSKNGADGPHHEVSAADYDPSMDQEQGEERLKEFARGREPKQSIQSEAAKRPENDIDDMFSLDETSTLPAPMGDSKFLSGNNNLQAVDDSDDSEGYYRITLGETLNDGRYQVFANLGKGMFSSVVKARDLREGNKEVAIKIVRSQEIIYKAGLKEISILKKLADADPTDKRHIVRLQTHFVHRNHLCMVFEALSMNLREVVRRFGKNVGLNIRAVKAYAHQMFLALSLMRKLDVMHADLKPDNVLVNDAKTILKICDLGSASDTSEMEITPYLVSRFYRAPEIILGQPYDCALDMWSMGCTLYELYTGKILFPGRSNNQMLYMMQEVKGKFTSKQIRRGKFAGVHFDDTNTFLLNDVDNATGQPIVRKVGSFPPKQDLKSRLTSVTEASRTPSDEVRLLNSFIDLLGRTLELDPSKRITPKEALMHPFLS